MSAPILAPGVRGPIGSAVVRRLVGETDRENRASVEPIRDILDERAP